MSFDNSVYQANGYADRNEYIQSLRDVYGGELVDAMIDIMPESEDFDGLIVELEGNVGLFE